MHISARGKYKTRQRQLIFDFLVNNKDRHVNIDEIIEYTKSSGSPVGKTTAYRYIDELEREGIIRKYIIDKGISACYQYIDDEEGCNDHFHLKCNVCGELYHLDCDFLKDIKEHLFSDHSFNIDSSKTVFYGTCKKCMKK